MDKAARSLGVDPAELRRRNFIPANAFPYDAPAGALYDSGDYAKGLDLALELADYEALKARRDAARAAGKLFGIGFACGVEPSGSNMAYVTLAQTPEERAKTGGRSGGAAVATVRRSYPLRGVILAKLLGWELVPNNTETKGGYD